MPEINDDVVDLTPKTSNEPAATSASDSNPFSFLDSVASSSPSSSNITSNNGISSNSNDSSLKLKIDDLGYKLERLIERLNQIDDKILDLHKSLR